MFTQQHYIAIAKILKDQDVYEKGEGGIVEAFVREFKQDNSKFDAERFRNACNKPLEQEATIGHMWVIASEGVEYDGELVAPI